MKKNDNKDILSQIKNHTKMVAVLVTSYGITQIMGNVLKDYQPDAKGIKKIMIKLGAAALTGMIIKEVNNYVEGEVDDIFETVKTINVEFEKKDKESEENMGI